MGKKAILLSLFFVFSLYASLISVSASINYGATHTEIQFSAHAYSNSPSAAYDGSNSSYAFMNVRGCDGQSCTSNSYGEIEYELTPLNTPQKIEFEWNIQPYDTFTPTGSTTTLSLYNHDSSTWASVVTEFGTISGWELVEVTLSSQYIGTSGEITLRLRGEHTDTGESSDELGIWLREFHFYSDDTDGDGLVDGVDDCPDGADGWISNAQTDYDSDGCRDSDEDTDDDNDGIADGLDDCSTGSTSWTSNSNSDYDTDGCRDSDEDSDDDNDSVIDSADNCTTGDLAWISNATTDNDGDGCQDSGEDTDDDNDGVEDSIDAFRFDPTESYDNDEDLIGDNADPDDDNDGYSDVDEEATGTDSLDDSATPADFDSDFWPDLLDTDDDNDGLDDGSDNCPRDLAANWGVRESSVSYSHDDSEDLDSDGCRDMDEDSDDDNDNRLDGNDVVCTRGGEMNWDSLDISLDYDQDGCRDDSDEDTNDDNDEWSDQEELECNTNPKDASDYPSDSDGDGVCDYLDTPEDPNLTNNNSQTSPDENTTLTGTDGQETVNSDEPEENQSNVINQSKSDDGLFVWLDEKIPDVTFLGLDKFQVVCLVPLSIIISFISVIFTVRRSKKTDKQFEEIKSRLSEGDQDFDEIREAIGLEDNL